MRNIKTYEQALSDPQMQDWLNSRLQEAVSENDAKEVESLLKQGANPNMADSAKQTVLHYAVEQDMHEIVGLLIDFGANIESRDEFSQTPMHWAAFSNAPRSAKILIERGADPNITTLRGVRPLMWAIEYDMPEVAKVIINAGVDPFSQFKNIGEMLNFFSGDLRWWKDISKEDKIRVNRMSKTKSLFKR